MKRVKCYGRQKVTEIKFEKSFITEFFDGNKSPDSLFDQRPESGNFRKKRLFSEDKENINTNVLESPTLFQNSYRENIKSSLLFKESNVNQKKSQKNKFGTYKKKYVKVKRNRRKPREINCNDLNYVQPRWSEFHQHHFTVEQLGSKRYLNASKHLTDNRNSPPLIQGMPRENSNCVSDVQNVEKNKSNTHSKSAKSSIYPGTRNDDRKLTLHTLDASHTDELNSSSELFTKSISFKVKKSNKKISSKISTDEDIQHLSTSKHVSYNSKILRSRKVIFRDNSNVSEMENTERNKRKSCDISVVTPLNEVRNTAFGSFPISHTDAIDSSGELFTASQSFKSKSNNKKVISQILIIPTNNQIELDNNFKKPKSFAEENHGCLNMNKSSKNSTSSFDHSRSLFGISSESSNMSSANQNNEDAEIYQNHIKIISKSAADGPDTNLETRKFSTSSQGSKMPSANQNKIDKETYQSQCENISKSEIFTTDEPDTYQHSNLGKRKSNISSESNNMSSANQNEKEMEKYQNENETISKSEMFATGRLDNYECSNLEKRKPNKKFVTSTPVVNRIIELDLVISSHSPSPCRRKTPNFRASHSASNYENTCDKSINKSISRSLRKEINNCNTSMLNNSIIKEYRLSLLLDDVSMFSQGSIKSFTVQNKVQQLAKTKRSSSLRNKSKSCYESPVKNSEECDELTKDNLLQLCNQEAIIPFADSYDWSDLKIRKIGEGTYGEVFTIAKGKSSSVLKVIPVSQGTDDESYQGLKNVLSEVKISKCLSDLRNNKSNQTKNFIKLNSVSLVSGLYPSVLINAWDSYSEAKSSYNSRPDIFDDKQLFVILDLEYGGKDMTCFVLRNAVEAESVLKQIAVSLAVAEEEFLFEHRDLHLGNILVQRNRRKNVTFKLRGHDITFECHGLQVTIIDFTLSRLYEDGYIYYNDLADDVSLFNQSGDFQFDIYRFMKQKLENQWHDASLYSNVLWLDFLCVKLKEYEYSRSSTVAHKRGLKAVDTFKNQLSHCDSALDCVRNCGISTVCFESDPNRALRLSKNSILVSRNSMQKSKSKLSICN